MSVRLLNQLQQNEDAAWDRLIRLYAPLIYHWCRILHVPEQDISDIFQEVFHALAKNISKFKKEKPGDTFRGWLRTITRNKVYDHFRKNGVQPQAVGGTDANFRMSQHAAELLDDPTEEETAQHQLFLRALDLIRADFAERTWNAFWQVVVDGKTPKETGQTLGMTPGAVRVAKSRVLHRLRQELGDLLE